MTMTNIPISSWAGDMLKSTTLDNVLLRAGPIDLERLRRAMSLTVLGTVLCCTDVPKGVMNEKTTVDISRDLIRYMYDASASFP
jgi:hypothetical protein